MELFPAGRMTNNLGSAYCVNETALCLCPFVPMRLKVVGGSGGSRRRAFAELPATSDEIRCTLPKKQTLTNRMLHK
jgi:hypothetical protein